MASTYSKLKIELIGTGDQAGQWGTTTNNNLGSSSAGVYRGLEQAIVGMATISSGFVANSYTLPYTNSNDDQEFRCLVLNITASLSNPSDLIVPAIQKPYIVINSSGQTVTVKVSGQTGVAVPNGAKILLYNTGTDVGTAITYLTELKLGGNLTMPSAGSINDSNGNELIKFPSAVASAVNELTISNAATGSAPTLSATGGDTNIGITLTPKGTGTFLVTGNTTLGDATSDTITLTGTVQPGVVISGSSSGDALRITQTGAGNALLVEDSTNPDSSPFVVTAAGDVGIGTSSPSTKLTVFAGADGDIGFFRGGSTRQVQIGTSSTAGYINTDNGSAGLELRTQGTARAYLDNSGNLGLGVTPSAWGGSFRALQVSSSALANNGANDTFLGANYYFDGTNNRYINTDFATAYGQVDGTHRWYTAASGTAGQTTTVTSGNSYTITAAGGTNYTSFGAANNNVGTTFTATSSGTGNGGGVTQNIQFTQALTLNANGALVLQGGNTSASGVGVAFPATQSASSNANTLDDYEEGTWTPAIRGSGTAGTYQLATAEGAYVKIGQQVTLSCRVIFGSITGGGTGYMQITGAPSFNNAYVSVGSVLQNNLNISAGYTWLTVTHVSSSGTTILYFPESGDELTSSDFPISGVSSGDSFFFTITYITST